MKKLKKDLISSYSTVLVYATKKCNLSCPRCFLRGQKNRDDMTWREFAHVIEQLNAQNVSVNQFVFTGGEPTLWPYLAKATELAKSISKQVTIITNGVDRDIKDFGVADVIRISHYGAINRHDILRLKKQGGKRVKVRYVVHLPYPFERDESIKPYPSDCGCKYLSFVHDKVYPCGFAAAMDQGGIPIESLFYHRFTHTDPRFQPLCKDCLSNRKVRSKHTTNLTFECGVWDSGIGTLFNFRSKGLGIRKLYRKVAL